MTRVQDSYPPPVTSIFAAGYDLVLKAPERLGLADLRAEVCGMARGRVLEVGVGTGLNLRHYSAVDSLELIEPDASLAGRLQKRLSGSSTPSHLRIGRLEDFDLPPGSFDTVVCTLVLCSVTDPVATLRQIATLLAEGGHLLFLEHVRAAGWRYGLQRACTPLWAAAAGGCHLDRDPMLAMRTAGLRVTQWRPVRIPLGGPLVGAAVLGSAYNDPVTRAATQ